MHRLGVGAAQPLAWADRDRDTGGAQFTTAQQIRQAAKAHYTSNAWLDRRHPADGRSAREEARRALAWLVEKSLRTKPPAITVNGKEWANPRRWRDAERPARLLPDRRRDERPASSPRGSSRRSSSMQMFVQRCFLNLEQAVRPGLRATSSPTPSRSNSWRQWKWMKNYRVVGGQPEGLPLSGELDRARAARRQVAVLRRARERAAAGRHHRRDRRDGVPPLPGEGARGRRGCEVAGVYHEIDDDNPYDTLPPEHQPAPRRRPHARPTRPCTTTGSST